MTSGGREVLKWIALIMMTGDHVARVLYAGYIPVLSELGRIAFPLFAVVLAYNLAQPGANVGKSLRRLLVWGAAATPVYWLALGNALPVNVLCAFALAACTILAVQGRRWVLFAVCVLPAPLFVDYQWAGQAVIVGAWWYFSAPCSILAALCGVLVPALALCAYNGSAWSLLAIPILLIAYAPIAFPRTRWAFYAYYIGHLALLTVLARFAQLLPSVFNAL